MNECIDMLTVFCFFVSLLNKDLIISLLINNFLLEFGFLFHFFYFRGIAGKSNAFSVQRSKHFRARHISKANSNEGS